MRVQDLVNTPVPIVSLGGAPPVTVSAFITPQSLISFPIASVVVKLLWRVAGALVDVAQTNNWVGLAAALAVGTLLYFVSTSDETLALSRRQKLIGATFALINTLVLFAAAAGLDNVGGGEK